MKANFEYLPISEQSSLSAATAAFEYSPSKLCDGPGKLGNLAASLKIGPMIN